MSRYLLVRSVSNTEPRYDSVFPNSGRTWPKRGSVVRIPEDEAWAYLRFSDVWDCPDVKFVAHEMIEHANTPESQELLKGCVEMLSRANINDLMDHMVEVMSREEAPKDEAMAYDPASSRSAEAFGKRIQDIASQIQSLPNNYENFDRKTNKPKLSVARKLSGLANITQRELDAAFALNKRVA